MTKYLLDTHIILWSLLDPGRLSKRVAKVLANPANELWVSPISTWEIVTLTRRRQLDLAPDPATWLRTAYAKVSFRQATMTHDVALAIADIGLAHKDPADWLLAASAAVYGLTLITADENLTRGKGFSCLPNR